ncbi:MAG TPA: filamentous hemagglutinin N-terminal domain-containing protein [Gammaproteobacteria bacterium]|nr:filamentous hemagglutinin N-terminal domain-containing protein [Gammaproteobacteria bacterium]
MQYKISNVRLKALFITLFCSAQVYALPDVNQIANGDVNITTEASKLQINQASDKAIVNWNTFNIAAQESVHFQQPTNGICLNRVDAANGMSQIDGSLSATGRVFLINQAGILFSETAQVNVGGIIASASDIANENFFNNKAIFDQPGATAGAVINRGTITVADQGVAALLGSGVANDGLIKANAAQVFLKSGEKFSFDFYGDGVVNYAFDTPATAAGVDEKGTALSDGLSVSGQIINDGGEVYLTSKSVQDVFDNLINMSGEIRAKSTLSEDGLIALVADEPGVVKVTGTLDVSGSEKGALGGYVIAMGDEIVIDGSAVVTAASETEGGYIQVGNIINMQIENMKIPTTSKIYVGPNAKLNADAITDGYGGLIIAASLKETDFLGTATAKGGAEGGDGGYVEISSKGTVNFPDATAKVDVTATKGENGEYIIGKPVFGAVGSNASASN